MDKLSLSTPSNTPTSKSNMYIFATYDDSTGTNLPLPVNASRAHPNLYIYSTFSAITGTSTLPRRQYANYDRRKVMKHVPAPKKSVQEFKYEQVERSIAILSMNIENIQRAQTKNKEREERLENKYNLNQQIKNYEEEEAWMKKEKDKTFKEGIKLEEDRRRLRGLQGYLRGQKIEICLQIEAQPHRQFTKYWPKETEFKTLNEDPENGNCGERACEESCGHNETNRIKNPATGCGRKGCIMHCIYCVDKKFQFTPEIIAAAGCGRRGCMRQCIHCVAPNFDGSE